MGKSFTKFEEVKKEDDIRNLNKKIEERKRKINVMDFGPYHEETKKMSAKNREIYNKSCTSLKNRGLGNLIGAPCKECHHATILERKVFNQEKFLCVSCKKRVVNYL